MRNDAEIQKLSREEVLSHARLIDEAVECPPVDGQRYAMMGAISTVTCSMYGGQTGCS